MFWIFLVRLSFLELSGVVLEDVGVCKSDFKIYLPIGFDILGIHLSTFQTLSEPTHVQCMILFAVSLLLLGWAWVGQTSRTSRGPRADLARTSRRARTVGLQIHPYIYPAQLWNVRCYLPTMCHCICRCKLICQTRCAIVGPAFSFRDVYAMLPTLCHIILLFESLKI